MFIILVHYLQPLDVIETYLEAHRRFLDKYYEAGIFLMSGPQVPRTGGVILARGLTREELEQILSEDPFYQASVATYQIIMFTPNKFSVDIEALLLKN